MKNNLMLAILIIAAIFTSQSYSQEIYTDNVVIVFDDSGSMGDSMRDAQGNKVEKIEAAKTALYEVLKQIPDTTHVGLVTFHKDWLYQLGKKDNAKLKSAINSLGAGGGTPLGEYIKEGADRLLQERQKQYGYGSYRLLVVTDGEAGDQGKVDRYTPEIISRGITFDVIGVAMADRHTLAEKAHSYRATNDSASLTKAIQEVFAEVSSSDKGDFGEDAFAELSGIPNEIASAMIKALSSSGNHPIGEKPKETKVSSQQPQTTQPAATQPSRNFPCVLIAVIAVIGIVLIVFVVKLPSGY